MYVCLSILIVGSLASCRQVISMDACFLKGYYGGQQSTGVGIEANDCIYPIAWAWVDKEKNHNWVWFLELLLKI